GWLNRAREASFLVTSRNVLGMAGETALPLSPLAPDDAAALFLRRARAARPDFQPHGEDEAAIVPLVRLLDGLPLAIELAAARVRVMPPRVLLTRMSERFRLLSASGARHERHSMYFAGLDERQATSQRCVELDNLVAACRHAVARGDAISATRALELAWAGLQLRGPFALGVELAAQTAAMSALPAALAAR